jgi:hypothetical protein
MLVTFPNQKKIKEISFPTLQLIQFPIPVQSSSPRDVPKEKKRKGTFSNIFKSRKNNLPFHLIHHFRIQYPRG